MMSSTFSLLGAALLLTAPALVAQDSEIENPSPAIAVAHGLPAWSAANGGNWHVYSDVQTGYAQFLFGGQASAVFEPRSDEDFYALGRLAIESSKDLHGIESGTLVEERFAYLPLTRVGTTDKITVRFRQEVGGVPVLGGYVNTLFTPDGQLLSVQTTAMPGVARFSTAAAIGRDRATEIALRTFRETTGLPGALIAQPIKAIGQLSTSLETREARLIWEAGVSWSAPDMEPESFTYWIDARDASVVRTETNIHHAYDVGGTLSSMATPGTLPDQVGNNEVALPMPHARISSTTAGSVHADSSGAFNFPGVTGPLSITVEYYGSFANVDNSAGAEYTLGTSINGTGNAVLMNPSSSALVTAQANAFRTIGLLRDYVRSVNPSDSTADFRALANTNISSTCNAYFNGNSVNFFQAGGGCANSAYSTIITHEMGHWLNVLYGTGNGSDGMGEGNSDVWAMYQWDTPFLGEDFGGPGSGPGRSGWNTRPFCGDSNPGCYNQVHTDGEVWMGAAWKVRNELNLSLGNAAGDATADALFLGWMNAYNQTGIRSVIETQWLTLDDDDGNIANGTPNYPEIDAGFVAQSFPGFDLAFISFQNVTELIDTTDEQGPYPVNATVTPLLSPSISSVDLIYRVGGGGYQTIPMSSTGGNDWTGDIPGQVSPAVVDYYVEASDSLGNIEVWPDGAPGAARRFRVGIITTLFFDDFEGNDNGWTHGMIATQDDWQHGAPQGKAGDPSSAASGTKIWGNDLGGSGWNGEYKPDVSNWLRSPVIDCSTSSGTTLSFNRWLTVQRSVFDAAQIKVNGVAVYTNPSGSNTIDTAWAAQTIDISALADFQSSIQIEFSLVTNGSTNFGGWNIDDFELFSHLSSNGCTPPVKYGTGKVSSLGYAPSISSMGSPSETIDDLVILIDLGIPGQAAILFSGGAEASVPFYGGLRLVSNPIHREGLFFLDGWGAASIPIPVQPGSSGTERFFQCWMRDPAHSDGTTVGMTDGLHVTFCD